MKQDIKEFFKKEYNADKNFQKILSNIKNETEEKMNQNKLLKMVATFVIAIGITAGVVYAGSVVYGNVFKAPEEIENYIEKIEINEEDLKNIITEEEAKREALEGIKRFGIEISEEDITDVFLDKSVPNIYSLLYTITVLDGEIYIDVDALTGKFEGFNIGNIDTKFTGSQLMEEYATTKENVIDVVKEKKKEYGFGDEYELVELTNGTGDDEKKSGFWFATFAKKYDSIVNRYQSVSISIIPTINYVYLVNIQDDAFEDNPIAISEKEAIKIAKNVDKKVNTEKYKVDKITATLSIEYMNGEVYLKENGMDDGNRTITLEDGSTLQYNIYKDSQEIRKVYVVEVSYKNRPDERPRKYYVDTTTGEIVGGENIFDLEGEELELWRESNS